MKLVCIPGGGGAAPIMVAILVLDRLVELENKPDNDGLTRGADGSRYLFPRTCQRTMMSVSQLRLHPLYRAA